MYLAISRLKVESGKETEFEMAWKNREQNAHGIKGFKKFDLFKGIANKESTLYIFHSEWNSEKDFINWTKSEYFHLEIYIQMKRIIYILDHQILIYTLDLLILRVLK